ncbi:hypothetical protein [Flavobacterium sp.]|uniref:hypothetical protein n=1 Tax=Flavobacterium sp. TaxID=239 RepID=UPI003341D215
MKIIKYKCINEACSGKNLEYLSEDKCPNCNNELIKSYIGFSEADLLIFIGEYPSAINNPLVLLYSTQIWYKRLHFISDILIGSMRILGNSKINIYKNSEFKNIDIDESIEKLMEHETLGAWPELISKIYVHLTTSNIKEPIENYSAVLGKSSKNQKKEKLESIENNYTDEFGKLQKVKIEGTPLNVLINFRNKYLGHGAVISEAECELIYSTYEPILFRFLKQIEFLKAESYKKINIESLAIEFPNKGNFYCASESCLLAINRIHFSSSQLCPNCKVPLTINAADFIDFKDKKIINEFPYLLAFPYQRALLEQDPYKKLHLLKETFLNYLKYLGLLTASEYFNSSLKIKSINNNFRELLYRPQFGFWNKFIRETIVTLNDNNNQWFIKELPGYYDKIETSIYDPNGEHKTAISKLIYFRNKYLGHGMVPSDIKSIELWEKYFPILKELLVEMDFCRQYSMVSFDNLKMWRLMGTEFKSLPSTSKNKTADRVQLLNAKGDAMNLVPFFVLPGEVFRKETSSKAKLMVYEQNTGKRIIFFSPESITDETSGAVLERLNLLLTNKDKEDPYTEITFTSEKFNQSLTYRNNETVRTLIKERKVLEGIYQSREDAEIALRSWIGARAGLFFISAEAGSGKTNLLVEVSKQYLERDVKTILLRANRMAHTDLWDEIKYQFNLSQDFEIEKAISFQRFTQENPFTILIDGGNEHANPNGLLYGVMQFLDKNKGGHIKVVLSWRVNAKSEIPTIENKYDELIYADNLEGKDENILARYCHWLTPLNKKELEGAWNFYITKNLKTHKPQFSLEELTYHDRSLTDQLNNPLLLRLFLELFHNRNLPKNKGFINIWSMYHERVIAD